MDMLLKESIIVRESGVDDKLVIAQRRTERDKREKDIQQAVFVLEIVKPRDFATSLATLPAKWQQLARKSLAAAWDLFPLERPLLERHGLAPQT